MEVAAAQLDVMRMEPTSTSDQVDFVTVFLRGVPLGTASVGAGDLVITPLQTSIGYGSFESEILEASRLLWEQGFLHPPKPRIAAEALTPSPHLSFEMRDMDGRMLHADFVNVVAAPALNAPPVVVVCRKHVNAAVASVLAPPRKSTGERGPANA